MAVYQSPAAGLPLVQNTVSPPSIDSTSDVQSMQNSFLAMRPSSNFSPANMAMGMSSFHLPLAQQFNQTSNIQQQFRMHQQNMDMQMNNQIRMNQMEHDNQMRMQTLEANILQKQYMQQMYNNLASSRK